jgi:putative ABC transport system permease protein
MNTRPNILRPRWRKVLSDLWDNKLRTLLVVASIAVGVFAVGTIGTAYVILSEDMNVSYVAANPSNIEIWTNPFDDNFVSSIKNVPGVKDAEGRNITTVRISQDGKTWLSHDLVAINDYEGSGINLRTPVEGATVPGNRQLLIEKSAVNDTDFEVGDVLQVQLSDDTIREMPVVGLVLDPTTGMGDFMALPKGYISMDTLNWLDQPENYNRLYATVSGSSDNEDLIEAVSVRIEDKIEKSNRQVFRTTQKKSNEHPMASTIQAILGVLGALGALVMILSSSLIANTLNALLNQHLRQIGVMKLVGARNFQISVMYILLIVSFGILAMVVSVPLGSLAGYGLAELLAGQMAINLQGFRIVPLVVILQVSIALIVPLAAGFFPVNSGSKITVRRAISEDRQGGQPSNAGLLTRMGERLRWISRPVMLSIRNTFRRKGRLLLTLFTLIMAGATFIAVFNVRASMEGFVEQMNQLFIADITLNFEVPYRSSIVESTVMQVQGVSDIEAWSAASAEVLEPDDSVSTNIQILAPPAESSLIAPDMVAGRWVRPGEANALVVADSIWDTYPDLQPGDTLRLRLQGEREDDWTVVGMFRFAAPMGDIIGYADYETVSEHINMPNKSFSFRVVTDEHTLEFQESIIKALDDHLRESGLRVSDMEAGLSTMSDASEGIGIMVGFLLFMALLTALVGSIGLMGTMGMNVLERTREIGVMRAIGAVDSVVIKSVIIEGVFIGLISWFFGAILTFPFSYLLLNIITRSMFNAPMPLAITPQGFLIWLLVVVALSVVASVLPARNASRLTIREVLAYE